MRLVNVQSVVLPPVAPAEHALTFFCDLEENGAPTTLLASMLTWNRLQSLQPAETSMLIAAGVRSEDAWYDLARAWMLETRHTLATPSACLRAMDALDDLFRAMRPVGSELKAHLKTHFMKLTHEPRPQATCFH